MEIIQIVAIGIICVIILSLFRENFEDVAIIISLSASILIFFIIVPKISNIITVLNTIADKSGINSIYVKTILKIIGVAYIAELGVQISNDADEKNIATKIELAGKIIIIFLSLPIIIALVDTIVSILP
ncbi:MULTISPECIES: stage III sporulation protein AD [Thermoanaerobacterium]|jgi:stage III sporulation protein AD|uniref:Stage III sporulation protein AD n=1 Tax=Thermoanaerobacterium xylanolyticum (strain ATCC 49914 / DSM 7097 / LX-11) TaxID=858215 RepID=F6BL27_THEXL|nr:MULTISPECIES: stage III sporulation protein AD [Thermoanaerobacterium]AEF17211.1 stage III sporulation protein AD [Thermoanaerobacterium xylanolyticum LX-11]MDE4541691.1 stage III sporulation protein AD [Thermoanaerobacterium sp. R66]ORX24101.1 stage III sporulation protein AD [Thermoanaerobacterium sp. PSU-2]HHV73740.1 stage III sporulation protein AD [Thermoanaerobacterium sp.]